MVICKTFLSASSAKTSSPTETAVLSFEASLVHLLPLLLIQTSRLCSLLSAQEVEYCYCRTTMAAPKLTLSVRPRGQTKALSVHRAPVLTRKQANPSRSSPKKSLLHTVAAPQTSTANWPYKAAPASTDSELRRVAMVSLCPTAKMSPLTLLDCEKLAQSTSKT